MNLNDQLKQNNLDLIVLKAFLDDIKEAKGISIYKLLKDANLKPNYYNAILRNLNGRSGFRKNINLLFILYISKVFDYPFNLSKYYHLLDSVCMSEFSNTDTPASE